MFHFPIWNCGWYLGLLIWRAGTQILALSSCCFLGQETSLKLFTICPGVWIVTGDLLQGPTLQWTGIASNCFIKLRPEEAPLVTHELTTSPFLSQSWDSLLTCAVSAITSISSRAFARVGSKCVGANSVCMTMVVVYVAFIQIFQQK